MIINWQEWQHDTALIIAMGIRYLDDEGLAGKGNA